MTNPKDDEAIIEEAPAPDAGEDEDPGDTGDDPAELVDELQQLGKEIGRSLKHAWDSEDRKRIESEVSKSLGAAGKEIGKVARNAGGSEASKQIRSGAETVGRDVREGLLAGLRLLNRELSKGRGSRRSGDGEDRPSTDDEDGSPPMP
jgi:hypothetical protein